MTWPAISVVVPTFERPDRLGACLEAMARLDYPAGRFEVVVVDDGTRPLSRVESVLAPFRRRVPAKLVAQAHGGPATARNRGAAAATLEFLAFTDDDCRPRPGWLKAFAQRLARERRRVLGGRTVNGLPDNAYAAASEMLVAYLRRFTLQKGTPIFPSNNLAMAREVFERAGGFDVRFPFAAGEDRELCDRLRARGNGFTFVPEAEVEHAHPLSLRSFLRQHFRYGRGAYVYHRARADRQRHRIEVEPLGFYGNLLREPFRLPEETRPWRAGGLLALTQVANALGFLVEWARRGRGGQGRVTPGPRPTGSPRPRDREPGG